VLLAKTNSNSQGQFSVNGQRSSSNYFTVDGASAKHRHRGGIRHRSIGRGTMPATSILGGMNALVSVDALTGVRVQTSTFAPEYGRTPEHRFRSPRAPERTSITEACSTIFATTNWTLTTRFANQQNLAARRRDTTTLGCLRRSNRSRPHVLFLSYEGVRLIQPLVAVGYSVPSLAAVKRLQRRCNLI